MIENRKTTTDIPEGREMWDATAFPSRLKEAVRIGGGGKLVARNSGVAYGTLNGYLGGQDPKWSNLVLIAKSCGISIDWLATGEGDMRPGMRVITSDLGPVGRRAPLTASEPAQAPLVAPIGTAIDLSALVKAVEIVEMLAETANQKLPTLEKAIRIKNTYLLLTEPEKNLPPLPHHAPRGS